MKEADLKRAVTEKEFLAQIIQLASLLQWKVYHTWTSIHSAKGFPDLVLVKQLDDGNSVCLISEVKSEKGKLTIEQAEWLSQLSKVKGLFVFVWRPHNFEEVALCLRTKGLSDIIKICKKNVLYVGSSTI